MRDGPLCFGLLVRWLQCPFAQSWFGFKDLSVNGSRKLGCTNDGRFDSKCIHSYFLIGRNLCCTKQHNFRRETVLVMSFYCPYWEFFPAMQSRDVTLGCDRMITDLCQLSFGLMWSLYPQETLSCKKNSRNLWKFHLCRKWLTFFHCFQEVNVKLEKRDELDSLIQGMLFADTNNSHECYYWSDPKEEDSCHKMTYDFSQPYPFLVSDLDFSLVLVLLFSFSMFHPTLTDCI